MFSKKKLMVDEHDRSRPELSGKARLVEIPALHSAWQVGDAGPDVTRFLPANMLMRAEAALSDRSLKGFFTKIDSFSSRISTCVPSFWICSSLCSWG